MPQSRSSGENQECYALSEIVLAQWQSMAQLSLQHCFSFKALWISVKCEKRHGDVFLGVLKQQH